MAGKPRLSADPAVGVADLQKALKEWLEEEGSYDVARLIKAPYQMSWKSAPSADWLGEGSMVSLFTRLFDIHTNGVLSGQKLKSALLKQSVKNRLNYTKKHDSDFLDFVDDQIRIAAGMYREICKSSSKYLTCVRKASVEEKERIDSVLSKLQLGVQPVDQVETEAEEAPAESLPASSSASVFSRVLQRATSAPSSPEAKSLVPAKKLPTVTSEEGSSASKPQLRRQLAFLELDKKEEEEMLKWMQTSVGLKKKKKKKKFLKRPAAKTEGKKKQKGKPKKEEPLTEEKKKAKQKKDSFVNKVLKSSFRKRKCDAAYHAAKKKALGAGATLEEACKAASEASAKVGEKIDTGELVEK